MSEECDRATFLAYLAAQPDYSTQMLFRDLSGLADGANDLAEMVAYLRSTLGDSEAVLAVEETAHQWKRWNTKHGTEAQAIRRLRDGRLSRESSLDLLTTCGNDGNLEGRQATTTNEG